MTHRYAERMARLCAAFPCLEGMSGTAPWDPELLAGRWATASSGERAAIQFVLSVWNSEFGAFGSFSTVREWAAWGMPTFSIRDFASLDEHGQAAAAAWFAAPFWP